MKALPGKNGTQRSRLSELRARWLNADLWKRAVFGGLFGAVFCLAGLLLRDAFRSDPDIGMNVALWVPATGLLAFMIVLWTTAPLQETRYRIAGAVVLALIYGGLAADPSFDVLAPVRFER